MAACVNVMFHPMGWVGITSPVRKIEGNFSSKRFTSSCTESGIGCIKTDSVADETEKEGSGICKMLGKNNLAAARAFAIQAKSTWLVSGTCHCSLQKLGRKKLALKLGL
jgi:hypothetical protein